jgi:hypothetical protein
MLEYVSDFSIRFLRLPPEAWKRLIDDNHAPGRFRYVVGSTSYTQTWRVAIVCCEETLMGAAIVRRFGRPGSGQDGLEFLTAEQFSTTCELSEIEGQIPSALQKYLRRPDGKPLPDKTEQEFEASLKSLVPEAATVLERIRERLPVPTADGERASLIREQGDAVSLGLEISGLDSRDALHAFTDNANQLDRVDVPFLKAWNQRHFSEASAIRHDFKSFDRWLRKRASTFDLATFVDPGDPERKVTVIYADKEPLERQTGTDLLYYCHHRPGFIFVQYKRMRSQEGRGAQAAYYPDDQLNAEIRRYRNLPKSREATSVDEWRITSEAFFVKLVGGDLSKPSENRLVRGMYLPLDLIDLLLKESRNGDRPKGWSSESVTTYLSNDEFLRLAKQGYIGTRGTATDDIAKTLVQGSIESGRGVIVARNETDPKQAIRLRHG